MNNFTYRCKICDGDFEIKKELEKHLKYEHDEELEEDTPTSEGSDRDTDTFYGR